MKTISPNRQKRKNSEKRCDLCNRALKFRPSRPNVGKCSDCDWEFDFNEPEVDEDFEILLDMFPSGVNM